MLLSLFRKASHGAWLGAFFDDALVAQLGFAVLARRPLWSPQPLAQQIQTAFEHVIGEFLGLGQQYLDRKHARGLGRQGRDLCCRIHCHSRRAEAGP
jgi:hypothetical protein